MINRLMKIIAIKCSIFDGGEWKGVIYTCPTPILVAMATKV